MCRDYIQNNTNTRATEAEKDVRKLTNYSFYGRMCMNPLNFIQTKFLHGEKIMKSVSKPTSKNLTRYKDYAQQKIVQRKKI